MGELSLPHPLLLIRILISPTARHAAGELGADPGEVEREARTILDTFVSSPLADLLSRVEILGREVPVLLGEGDVAWRGTLDLLYRDNDGNLVVADFKTDRDASDEALRTRYGAQLGVYRETVRRAVDRNGPPRAELWLVRSGRIVEI